MPVDQGIDGDCVGATREVEVSGFLPQGVAGTGGVASDVGLLPDVWRPPARPGIVDGAKIGPIGIRYAREALRE